MIASNCKFSLLFRFRIDSKTLLHFPQFMLYHRVWSSDVFLFLSVLHKYLPPSSLLKNATEKSSSIVEGSTLFRSPLQSVFHYVKISFDPMHPQIFLKKPIRLLFSLSSRVLYLNLPQGPYSDLQQHLVKKPVLILLILHWLFFPRLEKWKFCTKFCNK